MTMFCNKDYVDETDDKLYDKTFENYPFPLSSFQKWAIQGILEKKHVLITAHTGSGKTLPAEFAINYFTDIGKKVIYTSPIKALSNQKYYEFQKLFPSISFGLLTGDIKSNPEADVLIMTTEILRNTLFQKKTIMEKSIISDTENGNDSENKAKPASMLNFEMDIENDLACVVFDEIHYINDADRGKVWEETIMMLPNSVQMLMLSATLDRPENFANWIYLNKKTPVWIASTGDRVVPLKHYYFTTIHASVLKKMSDKSKCIEFENLADKPIVIKNKVFSDENYYNTRKILEYIKDNNIRVKRPQVLNTCLNYLKINKMLPAICFVFSRKGVEQAANEISVDLLDSNDDKECKIPSIIEDTCKKILLKLPNYKEYIHLPEYTDLLKLFKKGIAIHHSGMMPIFREMVEMVFSKGFIKLLFATETFAVGINMPTKTVLFSGLNKYDGSYNRHLYSHEYTQMAGRAGRRGLDKIGHVIHLNNLFEFPAMIDYKTMLNGKPQSLISKFKIHYNLVLNLIDDKSEKENNNNNITEKQDELLTHFIDKSMIKNEIDKEYKCTKDKLDDLKKTRDDHYNKIINLRTPLAIITEYLDKLDGLSKLKNKQWKRANREIKVMEETNQHLKDDFDVYKMKIEYDSGIVKMEKTLVNIGNYTSETVSMLLNILMEHEFIDINNVDDTDETNANNQCVYKLTERGSNSSLIQEWHCLAAAEVISKTNYLKNYSTEEIVALFSCFTNIRVLEEDKKYYKNMKDCNLKTLIDITQEAYNKYFDIEMKWGLDTGYDFAMHYDICEDCYEWCVAKDDIQCKIVIQSLAKRDIFVGEFVKAILKINNIAVEMEKICELNNRMDLLKKLREIPDITLKFIATNQSLYV